MEFLIPISLFFSVAAVLILRPLTKQLGRFLEALTRERTHAPPALQISQDTDSARTLLLLEHVVKRLDAVEDRLDFTERLVSTNQRQTPRLSVGDMPDVRLREETLHSAVR